MVPEVVDQSGSRIDPVWFVEQGGKVIAIYCGLQPWKVPPPSYVRACHKAGAGLAWFWEDSATNALDGAPQGKVDGVAAKRQMDAMVSAVGYQPRNVVQINVAVDFDTDPSQYPPIDAYLRAFDAGTGPAYNGGDYGEADLLDHVHDAGIMPDGYGTYAWSHGRVSVHAVMQQTLNGQVLHGAQVDFGQIIDAAAAGIWWPPGHALDTATAHPLEDTLSQAEVQDINSHSKAYADSVAALVRQSTAQLAGQVSALSNVVGQLAHGGPIDMAAVKTAAEAGATAAVAKLHLEVTP